MGTRYTVQRGDSLSRITTRHGLPSWRMVYNSPENADFRRRRPNPDLIQPGDVLILPDLPATSPTGRLLLPWNFASKFELPQTVFLDPIPRPGLLTLGPQLFPPSNPAFNFGTPSSPGSSVTLGGPVYDNPVTANGEPVHGSYSEALKWTGKAVLKYPWVHQRLDGLKDGAIDFAWRSAPWWQRSLEIGVGVGAGTLLLSLKPSRDFIQDKLHGTDIPLSPLGLDWLSVQPRLGIGGDWGGIITFDLQDILNPPPKKK
jgi:hypothetical protein